MSVLTINKLTALGRRRGHRRRLRPAGQPTTRSARPSSTRSRTTACWCFPGSASTPRRRSRSAGGSARSTTPRTATIPSPASTRSRWTSRRTPRRTTCGPPSTGTSTAARRSEDECPQKATVLSAKQVAETRRRDRVRELVCGLRRVQRRRRRSASESLRVVHSLEASQRRVTPDPSPEELARWRSRPTHEHPLVWTHRSGRKSLVLGASADYVVGMDLDEGRALLADLLDRATAARPGLQPPLVGRRHRHLGQPRRAAPGCAVRPRLAARDAAHHGARRRADRMSDFGAPPIAARRVAHRSRRVPR